MAAASSAAAGVDPLPGTDNYLLGNEPSQWHTGVPTYAAVRYSAVYPGVDLVYHGQQGRLEYDFNLSPGADPGTIRLVVDGGEHLVLDGLGNLIVDVSSVGRLVQPRPSAYQESVDGLQEVSADYVLNERGELGFALGAYDPTRPLVIDPVVVYSTYLGGGGFDAGDAIAVDAAGNAYVTGETGSANFPATLGVVEPNLRGSRNAFVTKLNAAGTAVVYSTLLGGTGVDAGSGIRVDAAGNAYVTGTTSPADFPTTPGAVQRTFAASGSFIVRAFVSKLNSTGTARCRPFGASAGRMTEKHRQL